MGRRPRIIGYGASLAFVVIGSVVAVLGRSVFDEALAVALVSIGLIAATSLVFYEVGLSEDRDRAREAAAAAGRRESETAAAQPVSRKPPRRLVRPGRSRGPR